MSRPARVAFGLLVLLAACGKIPPDRYGIDRVRFEGVEAMDEEALRGCLTTSMRPRAGLVLGVEAAGSCGNPPFDAGHTRVDLWAWPWTDWTLFDRIALEQDLRRIERWYEARGHHHAEVVEVRVTPEEAREDDAIDPDAEESGCERRDDDEGCPVDVTFVIEEGEPTEVTAVRLRGHEELGAELRERLEDALRLREGDRFDEALYDATKDALAEVLAEEGYARAEVEGHVQVHRPRREAQIDLHVDAGPPCVFGEIRVEGAEELPRQPILAAAGLYRGEPYSLTEMREARRSVYDLGAFATVAVEPRVPEEGNEVDIVIAVAPAKRHRFGVGVGVQSGILRRSQYENVSVEQWDLHLSARYENRRVFGRLPRLTIEDRPRVVFSDAFPQVNEAPRFGNLIDIELRVPGAIEKRTTLVIGAAHDYGPDNFGGRFFRHDVSTRLLLERFFWRHRIFASVGFRTNVRRLPGERDPSTMPIPPPSGYDLFYFEQVLRLDTRDDPVRPHRGIFLQLAVHEAFPPSSWTYFRVLPDARVYVPLPRRITLAARFALGMYFIRSADENLDPISQAVGPRGLILQGGGPTSNRGYLPGNLGDSETGGARRWEASLELRFPITASFGGVLFADAGDVRRDPDLSDGRQDYFRWDHPQTSVGLGFRYFSFLGPIRLDFAWQVKSLTVFGEDERIRGGDDTEVSFGFFRFPGAWHLSIGESF